MSSELGVSDEKIMALHDYAASPLYNDAERLALEYADCMTITGREVTDELFARLRAVYDTMRLWSWTASLPGRTSSTFKRACACLLKLLEARR